MAILKPDNTEKFLNLTVNKRLIPDSAVWNKDYGTFKKGQQYKANILLSGGTGKPTGITIHNTGRIKVADSTTPAEQYSRATWPNCNMGSVRVHYYVDDVCAWQNLRDDEVGWHCGDGNDGPGNGSTVAVEIIMDGSGDRKDIAAENNGALLAAVLLRRFGLTVENGLFTHKSFSPSGKSCPVYILPHWEDFKNKVAAYFDALSPEAPSPYDALRAAVEKAAAILTKALD